MYVLDTCTLLWWTLDPNSLSKRAEQACAKIDEHGAFISSITIWEIGIKIKKGLLNINEDIAAYVNRVKSLQSISIVSVDEHIWIRNLGLNWEHKDPTDRTIVATAMMKKLKIITKDKIIRDFYPDTIW
ncbi:type II toxin-antitoxin system VapC family toxin [candidate division KSB1 bacterium]|nr:type II toxin-antitoxin system VapC family toxin [candidate division KSB1 bacterium]